MQNRRVSYGRITCVALLVIVFIFGFDSLKRSAAKKNQNSGRTLKVSTTDDFSQVTEATEVPEETGVEQDDSYIKSDIDDSQYKRLQKSEGELSIGELVLINKDNSYKFQDISSVLVKMAANMDSRTFKLSYNTHQIQKAAMEPFSNMMADFYTLYNTRDVTVVSSHVAYADQNEVYKAPADPSLIMNENEMAPGYMEHHSGYALDFKLVSDSGQISNFDGTGNFSWITENCYKYGFILRYPEGKESVTGVAANPAHFRYVGLPHSYIMHDNGFTLEEYLNDLKKYTYGYDKINYSVFGYDYEVYYVPKEEGTTVVPVPLDATYTVSGNNYDGFIVTACRASDALKKKRTNGAAVTSAADTPESAQQGAASGSVSETQAVPAPAQ